MRWLVPIILEVFSSHLVETEGCEYDIPPRDREVKR